VDALLPDVDAALISFLANHASLTSLHGGRVGTKLGTAFPAVRVTNLGAQWSQPWETRPEFQVECWGDTQGEANLLARTVRAVIPELRGPVASGYVTAAITTLDPRWMPDPDTNRPRYLMQAEITATR